MDRVTHQPDVGNRNSLYLGIDISCLVMLSSDDFPVILQGGICLEGNFVDIFHH